MAISSQSKFCFILTRHVQNERTNKYWNNNVKLLRTFYPLTKINIIDDNSKQEYVRAEHDYKNVEIVASKHHGRGELLPYLLFKDMTEFESAVIIHDSTFFHKRIPFETLSVPVMPLWHFAADRENRNNLLRIVGHLKHNYRILDILNGREIMELHSSATYRGCFGGQAYITRAFLKQIDMIYDLNRLVPAITCRADRCSLERILGAIFYIECPQLRQTPSLLGNIRAFPRAFVYTFEDYEADIKQKKVPSGVVKVWSGR